MMVQQPSQYLTSVEELLAYNKQFHSGAFQEDIDIHELTKGIYIIKLDADRKSESVKLIVR